MLKEYETDVKDWFNKVGLDYNPFTLRITPSLFVGYQGELKELTYHIQKNHKFAMVVGATGSGKTTLLKLVEDSFKDKFEVIYLSKPPELDEIVDIFLERFKPSFFRRLFGSNVSIHELSDYLNDRINERVLLLLDEAHESNVKVLQWLRTITDQTDGMQLIFAGLPSIDKKVSNNVETLKSRVTTKIRLNTLSESETLDLIRNRIEDSGGEDLGPFSRECISEIYEKTGGFPREVLKTCDKLIKGAMEKDKYHIDTLDGIEVEEEDTKEDRRSNKKELLQDLPYKQREIVKILADEDDLYPSEVAEKLGTDSYKTKQHAVRSVNNILRRLIKEDLIKRKKRGKGYVYSLNTKTKNLLVES